MHTLKQRLSFGFLVNAEGAFQNFGLIAVDVVHGEDKADVR
jgi:hypothetical protein